MMTKGTKIIIIIVVGLIAISALIYFVFFFGRQDQDLEPTIQEPVQQLQPITEIEKQVEQKTEAEKQEVETMVNIESLSLSFAERYGSYSSQSNFENITELKLVMTENMKKWADQYVAEQRKKMPDSSEYYGITTKAISTDIVDKTETNAKVLINTQRIESFADGSTIVGYQEIEITLLNQNGEWKVDAAVWK